MKNFCIGLAIGLSVSALSAQNLREPIFVMFDKTWVGPNGTPFITLRRLSYSINAANGWAANENKTRKPIDGLTTISDYNQTTTDTELGGLQLLIHANAADPRGIRELP